MKAIILAGGFAKRLWPLTESTPKPLLPVAGKPIIDYLLERISCIKELDRIFISVNQRFEPNFREWAGKSQFLQKIEIVAEPSRNEEEKLGAIGALGFLIHQKAIDDDLLVVAGDNLFDFDVGRVAVCGDKSPVVALYKMPDADSVKKKYGVVQLDSDNRISDFQEKPEKPASTLISTGCYFFPKGSLPMIYSYLSNGYNPDAPGFFIEWLSKQMAVRGMVFDSGCRWFDIGSKESYREANRLYSNAPG